MLLLIGVAAIVVYGAISFSESSRVYESEASSSLINPNVSVPERSFELPQMPDALVPELPPATEPAETAQEEVVASPSLNEEVQEPSPQAPETGLTGDRPVHVKADSISLDDSVRPQGLDSDGQLTPPGGSVVWHDTSALPNSSDSWPMVIAAHVTYGGRADKFYDLHRLQIGDLVEVFDASGVRFIYRVVREEQRNKYQEVPQFLAEVVYTADAPHSLWLITCGGDWDTSRRSHDDNVFRQAVLVDIDTG
jgi:hypothetical protein